MISIRTNVDSLNAQENLNINSQFQSKTIQQLTSGYRINSSGDDAAGLAIANSYRNNIAELNQGVSNANDGVSQLQIIDGGLSNVSTILDRMKTLATESASDSFTGDRNTLNQEYSQLIGEITRQASNINLNAGGTSNALMNVYIGGANTQSTATVAVDLSGNKSAVDAVSLGLSGTSVNSGSATGISTNTLDITSPGAAFVKGTAGTDDQTFTVNYIDNSGVAQNKTLTVTASTAGTSLSGVLNSLNSQLAGTGVQAGTNATTGALQFSGTTAFTVKDDGSTGTSKLTNTVTATNTNGNVNNYQVNSAVAFAALAAGKTETLSFTLGSGAKISVQLDPTVLNAAQAVAKINQATAQSGIYAVQDASNPGKIDFQSASSFQLSDTSTDTANGVFGTNNTTTTQTVAVPTGTPGGQNATAAISAIDAAVKSLGLVQGTVGAGENKLQYAISLAQSQISSFSAAQSQIRDADVAAQAANLTKSQVLQQTSIAAMAQANQEPQSILKLLQ